MLIQTLCWPWENDSENPMFIDRDGDKFGHVLDYLRYGSIELPVTIPQAMFQRELDYYGIAAVVGSVTQEKKKTLGDIIGEMTQQKQDHNIFALAAVYFDRYKVLGYKSIAFTLCKEDGDAFDNFHSHGSLPLTMKTKLDEYLDYFGLSVQVGESLIGNFLANRFHVSIKK